MSGKIILRIVKTILRIVMLKTGFPARAQKKMFVGKSVNSAGKWSVENERLCKASAEAKFTWTMSSRRQFSCKRVQSRTCSGYAERSRKCQEKVHFI